MRVQTDVCANLRALNQTLAQERNNLLEQHKIMDKKIQNQRDEISALRNNDQRKQTVSLEDYQELQKRVQKL